MKLIYIGYVVPKYMERSSKAISIAGNNMQLNLLRNFKNKYLDNIKIISVTPTASYPIDKKIFVHKKVYTLEKGLEIESIGFVNINFLKQIYIILRISIKLLMTIIKVKKKNMKEKIVIITYNSASIISLPIFIVSLFFKITKICLVADYPIVFQKKRSRILEVFRKIENKIIIRNFKKYDGMISLVEKAVLDFAPKMKYILINYCIEQKKINDENLFDTNKIQLTYTGALEEYYGIKEVIESMNYLSSEYNLNLYGKGSLVKYIKDKSNKKNNIFYHGLVSNYEAVNAQRNSSILLLIRNNDTLNKYGLPSKIIEYLSSGTPVISTRINSIPKNLEQYINYVDDDKPDTIAKKIVSILNEYDMYKNKALDAEKFIIKNFEWDSQVSKIGDFITELI